ncbi:hypothetical protein PtrSN002B_011221, partial [Pyrenophora tritici-repentis]
MVDVLMVLVDVDIVDVATVFSRQFSKVVNGLAENIWRSTTLYPSKPQIPSPVGVAEDEVVAEEVVSSGEVEVTETSEDMLDEIEMEDDVVDSIDDDEPEKVLVGVENRVELEEMLVEIECEVELDETLLELPQYEYWEQQLPYFPPMQVIPAGDAPYKSPQRTFVVIFTFTIEEGAVDKAIPVEVLRLEVVE